MMATGPPSARDNSVWGSLPQLTLPGHSNELPPTQAFPRTPLRTVPDKKRTNP